MAVCSSPPRASRKGEKGSVIKTGHRSGPPQRAIAAGLRPARVPGCCWPHQERAPLATGRRHVFRDQKRDQNATTPSRNAASTTPRATSKPQGHQITNSQSHKTTKPPIFIDGFVVLAIVRRAGLEPARCYPLAPQASASANSATLAWGPLRPLRPRTLFSLTVPSMLFFGGLASSDEHRQMATEPSGKWRRRKSRQRAAQGPFKAAASSGRRGERPPPAEPQRALEPWQKAPAKAPRGTRWKPRR